MTRELPTPTSSSVARPMKKVDTHAMQITSCRTSPSCRASVIVDADLVGLARGGVSDRAVGTDGDNDQPNRGKDGHHHEREAGVCVRELTNEALEGSREGQRQVVVGARSRAAPRLAGTGAVTV